MKNIFVILLLLFSFSCAQESAEIIYRNDSSRKTRNSSLKPSYMKGSYVENSDKQLFRDLRKEYSENSKNTGNDGLCGRFITVGNGDSLLRIARKCGCSLTDIANINNIKPPYNVYVGQKIKTNCINKAAFNDKNRIVTAYKTVTVEKGSSLIRIAIDNNSTLRELAAINSIEPPYNVFIGQKIRVPIKNNESKNSETTKNNDIEKSNTMNGKIYIVKKGDNIYSIAKKTNTSFTELVNSNNLKKPYNIYVGQKLKLSSNTTEQKNKTESSKKVNKLERVKEETEIKAEPVVSKKKQEPTKNNSNGSMFIWPVKGEIIKKFGKQDDGSFHDAINIKSAQGAKIQAADAGEVAYAGNELKGFGNIVIIKHKNGWLTVYGHCDSINVKVKDKVEKGQAIAVVGKTGNVNEPQLYFSLRKGRTTMDPLKYLTNN